MTELDLTNRVTLMKTLPHGKHVVEVGVERGVFSRIILEHNEPAQLTLVDSWCSRPGTAWDVKDPSAQANHDNNYRYVLRLFAAEKRVQALRLLSLDAAQTFPDGSLDIVYLDADHTTTAEDIQAWWPKVKPGGWLCGHDYTMTDWITVKHDVDEWVQRAGLTLHTTREPWPSWAVQKTIGDIVVLVTVYPPYADLLPAWLQALERFWPKHPALIVGKSMRLNLAERMLRDVQMAEGEFVVMFHEDFRLCLPVKQTLFEKCLKQMRADVQAISCSLTWEPSDVGEYDYLKKRYSEDFEEIPRDWDYAINFQARIWRRKHLIQILEAIPPGTSNGRLEPLATQAFRRLFPKMRVISYAIPAPADPSTFVDSTDKSHWIIAYKNIVHAGQR